MLRARWTVVVAFLPVVLVGTACSRLAADVDARDVEVVVDAEQRFQTIGGFGSSQRAWTDGHLASLAGPPSSIPRAVQGEILAELYTELGLTRFRPHGIGRVTEPVNDNADPTVIDRSKFVFDGPAGDGDGVDARIDYARQASDYGLTTVLSENNPMLGWMDGSNPEEYAENTLALLLHWRAMGLEPRYQTLANEPSGPASRIPWAYGAWHREVVKAMGPRMRDAGLQTMLVIPDDVNPCSAYPIARTVLEDPAARPYVGAVAYHLYGGRPACMRDIKALSERYGVPVWMTEHTTRLGYDGSLEWAKTIHDLFANYGVSAADHMWGFFGTWDNDQSETESLIDIAFGPDGGYLSRERTSKYYVTGQFSRFVRPGYVRVGAGSSSRAVLVTAYQGDGELVVVLINDGEQAANVSLRGAPAVGAFSGARTSRSENRAAVSPITPGGAGFRVTLPPRSVTTLVGSIE